MIEFNDYQKSKRQAIIEVYNELAQIFENRLRQEVHVPLEFIQLKSRMRHRVTINELDISMIVGFINSNDYNDYVGRQIHFLMNGSKPHWVSLKKHSSVVSYALRHGIITQEGGKFYWAKGKNSGKVTTAILLSNTPQKDRVNEIKNEIYQILIKRITAIGKGDK